MNFLLKQDRHKFLYIIFFILIWSTIDTNFENFILFFDSPSYRNFILFLRSSFVFLIFAYLSRDLIKERDKNFIFRVDKSLIYLSYIFFIFLLIQLVSHFLSGNKIIFTYYFFLSFFLLIYFIFASNNDLLNISFVISLIFLSIVFIIFTFLSIKYFFTNGDLTFYGTFPHVYKSMLSVSSNVVRSSGLSRTSMLIYIPLILYLFLDPVSKKKFILIFFVSFIILLTQSRIVLLFWFGYIIFLSYFFWVTQNISLYFKKIIILVILPFVITGLVLTSKYYLLQSGILITDNVNNIIGIKKNKEDVVLFNNLFGKEVEEEEKNSTVLFERKLKLTRKIDPGTFSSGRANYWKNIIKNNKNFLIGNGFLGDRLIIDGNNASNILFYTYASSGIIGSLLIFLIILRCIYISFDLIFLKKINLAKKNIILISSIFYLGFLIFRGISENSFAIFSIDLIIFLQSLFIVEKNRNRIIKNKI